MSARQRAVAEMPFKDKDIGNGVAVSTMLERESEQGLRVFLGQHETNL